MAFGEEMKEILMVICMGAGGTLFAIGGMGPKWVRRFLLPCVFAGCAYFAGFEIYRCLILMGGLMIAFCLPYGEKIPYWGKALVGVSYVLPTLALGFNVWQIITPIVFLGLFRLSNIAYWSGQVPWKIFEFSVGSILGITISQLISQVY